ncbi:MAG TPA: porin [Burkholderiales bacterium]|nr:porin [Burkholderiales bacterium]
MNKNLIALAVAAAVAAPAIALADNSTVSIYGTLNVDVESVQAKSAAGAGVNLERRNRVSNNSANIGFRGVEPLGGGVDAWFQIENNVPIDSGGGGWSNRNSAVGLKGSFGNVNLGLWDTPYKFSTGRLDPFGNTSIAAYTGVVGGNVSPLNTGNAANRASFDRRQQNFVQYWSPNLGGFSGRVGYGANEEKNAAACAGIACDPQLLSLSLAYENGPIYVTAAYEKHDEYANTATTKSDDTAWKVGGAFTFAGSHTVSAMWERLNFEGSVGTIGLPKTVDPTSTTAANILAGTANEAEMDTWFVSYLGKFGPHNLRASYGQNNELEIDGTEQTDTKARFWALGYGYAWTKRTELYALYVNIDNDTNSSNTFGVNTLAGAGAGADPRGFGVGVKHTF